jgi:hypothetical protein
MFYPNCSDVLIAHLSKGAVSAKHRSKTLSTAAFAFFGPQCGFMATDSSARRRTQTCIGAENLQPQFRTCRIDRHAAMHGCQGCRVCLLRRHLLVIEGVSHSHLQIVSQMFACRTWCCLRMP